MEKLEIDRIIHFLLFIINIIIIYNWIKIFDDNILFLLNL